MYDKFKKKPIDNYLNCREYPRFTSNIIIEYYSDERKYVKIKYNGIYVFLCDKK